MYDCTVRMLAVSRNVFVFVDLMLLGGSEGCWVCELSSIACNCSSISLSNRLSFSDIGSLSDKMEDVFELVDDDETEILSTYLCAWDMEILFLAEVDGLTCWRCLLVRYSW